MEATFLLCSRSSAAGVIALYFSDVNVVLDSIFVSVFFDIEESVH